MVLDYATNARRYYGMKGDDNMYLKYFNYEHLPEQLKEISKPIGELAYQMENELPDGAEKSAGMRKLLEAKDCFVRSKLN